MTSPPSGGDLTGTPPTLTYTPRDGVDGTDSFEFTATANGVVSEPADGHHRGARAGHEPADDRPAGQSVEVLAGQSVDIPVAGNDLDGDALAFAPDR